MMVAVNMSSTGVDRNIVLVAVMLIMHMLVLVFERNVRVGMFMSFGEMKPNADSH